jgi:sulfite exporter TauE/SafE
MDTLSLELLLAAFGIALVHTLAGPDHYLPFVMLARARKWSARRTLGVTAVCGVGHVASSLVLGGIGVAVGVSVGAIEGMENARGELAAWLLVGFGAAYGLWGLRRAIRGRRGLALHAHGGHVHLHEHGEPGHDHHHARGERGTTFWALFVIFVLGPCEPLIPLVIAPASTGRWQLAAVVAVVFSVTTILTMLAVVLLALLGAQRLRLAFLERWAHALAGGMVAASGLAILFLGL